jgi:hypothetical protein
MQDQGILYFHIRPFGFYKAQENETEYLNRFMLEYEARSGTTFAFEKRTDGWYFGYSSTHSKDQFNRKIGRMVAKGRLCCKRKPELASYFGEQEPTFDDCVIINFMLHLESHQKHVINILGQERAEALYDRLYVIDGSKSVVKKPATVAAR